MLSYLICSMNRPELLRRMIQSLLDTSPIAGTEYCLGIDVDAQSVSISTELLLNAGAKFNIDFSKSKRGSLETWNVTLKNSVGDLLFPCGDDQLAYPGWYEKAIQAHLSLGCYGVVGLNDLMHDGSVTTATTLLFDRKFVKEQFGGRITYPCYKYYCQDSELNERAKRTGKFIWLRDAIVEHIHAANGKRPFDEHDKERAENEYQVSDTLEFERRKGLGFPDLWEAII